MHLILSSIDLSKFLTQENIVTYGIIAITLIAVLIIYRMLKDVSPLLLLFVVGLGAASMIVYWARTRTEPAFMTPIVDVVSHFIPENFDDREYKGPK